MFAARRLLAATRLSAIAPRVASRAAGSSPSLAVAAARAFATARSSRRRSVSAKRRSASKSRRAASPRASAKRSASRRRDAAAAKAKATAARKREDRKREKEQEAKDAKRKRIAAQREKAAQREEKAKAHRAVIRARKSEQRRARKEREVEHAREVRERARYRAHVKKDRENEVIAFRKLRQTALKAGDPNKPKRALSAWTFFVKDKLPAALASAAGDQKAKATAALKSLSEEWKALPAESKKPYEDKAAADKERSAKEHASYAEFIPKQPVSSFMLWSTANRATIESGVPADLKGRQRTAEIAKRAGEQWKSVSAEEKAKFEAQYAEAKTKFEAAKEKFVAQQLALLPADLHEIMRPRLPGRVSEIPAWVGKVQSLLQKEMSASEAAAAADGKPSKAKKASASA